MVRTAYGINGDSPNDCFTACFCPCCSANQLYQTTRQRGNPTIDGGLTMNRNQFQVPLGTFNLKNCVYSCFCMPCAIGGTICHIYMYIILYYYYYFIYI